MAELEEPTGPGLASLIGAYQSPHRVYDAARQSGAAYFDRASRSWVVTGHAAVRAILGDERFSSQLEGGEQHGAGMPPRPASFLQAAIKRQIVFSDDERHRRVQHVILRESARTMHEAEPALVRLAERLLAPAAERGRFDLVHDFALPYTLETIARMIGIPTDDGRLLSDLAQWSTSFANVTSGYLRVSLRDIDLLGDYFRALAEAPQAGGLIAAFRAENIFADEEDLVVNTIMVFGAGRVTTQKVLCDGVAMLMDEWAHWRARVREEPGIVRHLGEELLRMVTPTRYVARRALADVDLEEMGLAGTTVRKGEKLILFLEAANRDPQPFALPHTLRPDRKPNPQIAFGHGPHRCPGASIARLEIQVALQALFGTFTELRRDPAAAPEWDPNPNIGGYTSYPCLCR